MEGGSSFNGFQALNGSNTPAGAGGNTNIDSNGNTSNQQQAQQCGVREQDRFMPIANVIRIMRKVLPSHAKISDDAKETIQECVSEYISFITSEANDRCKREQRKTITADDVLWAMNKLGFDNYIEPLTLFLHKYRELEGDHRASIRGVPLPPMLKNRVGTGALLSSSGPSVAIPPPLQPAPPTMPLMPMGTATADGMMGMGWDHQHLQHQHYHHHQFQHMMGGYYYGNGAGGGGSSSQHHQLDYPNGANDHK